MARLRRSAQARKKWRAWVSDANRLLRIARIMEDLLSDPLQQALGKLPDDGSDAAQDTRIREMYAVRLTGREKEFSLSQTGDPAEVLENTDPAVLTSVTLSAGRFVYPSYPFMYFSGHNVDRPLGPRSENEAPVGAAVFFSRNDGVALEVAGDDPDWVRNAFATLKSEVGRGAPTWSFLRAGWMWIGYFLVTLIAALIALAPSLGDSLLIYSLMSIIIGVAGGSGVLVLTQWLLPGFEILAPGRSGKAGRVLSVVGTVVLNVVVGVVVNLATRS